MYPSFGNNFQLFWKYVVKWYPSFENYLKIGNLAFKLNTVSKERYISVYPKWINVQSEYVVGTTWLKNISPAREKVR